jgi:hypothetical protein
VGPLAGAAGATGVPLGTAGLAAGLLGVVAGPVPGAVGPVAGLVGPPPGLVGVDPLCAGAGADSVVGRPVGTVPLRVSAPGAVVGAAAALGGATETDPAVFPTRDGGPAR